MKTLSLITKVEDSFGRLMPGYMRQPLTRERLLYILDVFSAFRSVEGNPRRRSWEFKDSEGVYVWNDLRESVPGLDPDLYERCALSDAPILIEVPSSNERIRAQNPVMVVDYRRIFWRFHNGGKRQRKRFCVFLGSAYDVLCCLVLGLSGERTSRGDSRDGAACTRDACGLAYCGACHGG